jgi:flagellar biosynthetic protein FliP
MVLLLCIGTLHHHAASAQSTTPSTIATASSNSNSNISALSAPLPSLPAVTATPSAGNSTLYSVSLQTLVLLSALSFLPSILLMMTSFTRIVIVLSLLRMALGTQSSPPNQIIIGLALFMSAVVMSPVIGKIYQEAYIPFSQNKINITDAMDLASPTLKNFMLKQTREPDIGLFMKLSKTEIKKPEDLPLTVVVPAFVTSELKTAFQIGFMIFIPFLIIDLVVASVLMSLGMVFLSPALISMPIKLMLFVLSDGWNLLIGSLIASFDLP